MTCKTDDLSAKLVECLNDKDDLSNDLDQWIQSLKELSDMKKAFPIKKEKLDEKQLENVIDKLRQVGYVCFYVMN